MSSLRKWLLSGLLVLVPLMITLWVLEWVVSTLDQTLSVLPANWHPDQVFGFHIPGLGVVFALAVLLSIGALASNVIGNRLVNWWHALLHRIPVVRSIYSGVKQISDTLFSEQGQCVSQGAAGSVAARRHVDHRFSHRLAGWRGAAALAGHQYLCPRRR